MEKRGEIPHKLSITLFNHQLSPLYGKRNLNNKINPKERESQAHYTSP